MDNGTIELAIQTIQLNYNHLFGITILYFDHLITLNSEIQFVWMRKWSTSSFWFILVRYIGFTGNLPVLLFSFMTLSPKIILVVTQFLVSVVAILRTYALYSRSNRVLGGLVVLGVCLIAVSSWTVHGQHAIPVTVFPGCHLGVTESTFVFSLIPLPLFTTSSRGYHLSVSWVALFLFDATIFGLTIFKTYSTRLPLGGGRDIPLHMLIARDGAMYFAAMAFANLANIMTYILAGPLLRGSFSTFANCVSVSMMSRLMLNLYAKANTGILSQLNLNFEEAAPLNFRDPTEYPVSPLMRPTTPLPESEPEPPGGISVVRRSSEV
ncbi:hypothetical protein B0H19DRAFT_1372546 [Mycena capillaripes]|nr:hypothetical protein B0H19DRAFT_1372546 [Mycena capillaripes]